MKKIKLGDLLTIKHGYAFKSEHYLHNGNFALVTLANISESNNFQFDKEKLIYYGANFPKDVILNEGDLILPMTEQVIGLLGNSAFVPRVKNFSFVLNQRVGKVIPKSNVDKYYLHFLLATKEVKTQLEYRASGTKQRNISPENIYDVTVFIPELSVQKKIGYVLYSLEQKINLNKKINATLEEMAKTIYDYYFVQFDFPDENGKPYKSSGGKMIFSPELQREIPEGWEVGNLNLIAYYVNGLACQNFRPKDDENFLPVVKIREIHEGINFDTEKVSANIPEKNIIDDGDILFSWSATLEVNYWIGGRAGLNQHIFKVIPKKNFCKEFVYHQLREYVIYFVKIAESRKTTMGHITQEHLNFSRIAIPPKKILSEFEKKISPIHKKIIQSQQENNLLEKLRNFLLPMLMNGQVGFKEE